MLERRSLRTPITLGVVMIVLVVLLAAVWVTGNLLAWSGTKSDNFWIFLAVGSVLLAAVLAGVIAYLTLTVKAFNLNRRQSNFIDAVTHELKSPIASLKLYLQTMARHPVSENQRQDFHRFMLEDVERLDALINHLLDVARVERGMSEKVPSKEDVFRIDKLLVQCGQAACLRYSVPPSTVEVVSPMISIRGSIVQAEILFRNLIDNAIKYGGEMPKVEIAVEPIGDTKRSARITVSDNGAGIPLKHRRKVFGRFVRLGSELERSRPGTGLGLYLVRNITRSLKGSIKVNDRQQGPGTRFEVTLPGIVEIDDSDDSLHEPDSLSPVFDIRSKRAEDVSANPAKLEE
jgi:two-component system, OmpR family, phosphate regulon sensor histidine kinase PhoR